MRYLVLRVGSTAIVASSLVFGAPVGAAEVVKFKTTSTVAEISTCDPSFCLALSAQVYDDEDGVLQGIIQAQFINLSIGIVRSFRCSGPTFSNVVAVDQQWKTTISANVSPSDPNCTFSFPLALTINLTGTPDRTYHESNNGSGTITADNGYKAKYKIQSDIISETFTGTAGFTTSTFPGFTTVTQRTDL